MAHPPSLASSWAAAFTSEEGILFYKWACSVSVRTRPICAKRGCFTPHAVMPPPRGSYAFLYNLVASLSLWASLMNDSEWFSLVSVNRFLSHHCATTDFPTKSRSTISYEEIFFVKLHIFALSCMWQSGFPFRLFRRWSTTSRGE